MGKIRVLDEQLANQIAAGEVVERPSSVVKELVENAVDAGSSAVDVAIEEGGLALIRVTDNGSGIEPDDLETAFQRHATSKLLSGKDLFRIVSLGFRGEALPSIAAVARVECVSAAGGDGLGRRIVIEGGAVREVGDTAAPQGTDMAVRDLFYNTPARLKYMKSIQTELGHITDYMNRLALAHPGIAFTLKHNGAVLLRTLGNGDRLQVIAAIYGTGTARSMLAVEGGHPDYELRGYLSKPELTKANRNGITTIVNGRYIRSFPLNTAIMQAYHTLLPINRYPLAVLEIGMHPELVDVNVHPSKMEVRFSKETELREFVERVLKERLAGQVHIPAASADRSKPVFVQERIAFHRPEPAFGIGADGAQASGNDGSFPARSRGTIQHQSGGLSRDEASTKTNSRGDMQRPSGGPAGDRSGSVFGAAPAGRRQEPERQPVIPPDAAERLYAPSARAAAADTVREAGSSYAEAAAGSASLAARPADAAEHPSSAAPEPEGFPELEWIGQMHGTYLIAQNETGMYLIDQHAAHERINYEYYVRKFGEPEPASQQLLVPLTLEFTAGEAELLRERLGLFAEAGVELEPFGPKSFLVRAYPEWLPGGDELPLIEEMAEWILSERKGVDIGKLREKAAILCSCKASIKANQRMTREAGEALLRRLAACSQPYTCPHGRPIVVHISTYQLEKMFKRVMS